MWRIRLDDLFGRASHGASSIALTVTTRPTIRAANGIVASGHPLATEAGVAALRGGGNAADAAVAAAAVLAVVKPMATSIGGDVFALVYEAKTGKVKAHNGSGAAPLALDLERFSGGYPSSGALLATVPGAIAAMGSILADHGHIDLGRALEPAIDYAERGFVVSDLLAADIGSNASRLSADQECARILLPGGRPPRAGEMLRQPELAASLRELATDGALAFYRGALAERLARGIQALEGAIAMEDLAAHATDRPAPLTTAYHGLTVYGQPPPSQGHVFMEELAIAEGLDLAKHEWRSAELVHLMVESKKAAFADRDAFAGDPRFVEFDAQGILDPAFVAGRRDALRRPASTAALLPADTTYVAVVDRDGNAVSLIESVFSQFGAGVIVPKTGVLLNNRLVGFSLDARSPNALAPGKRPVHTLNTVLVLDSGRPRLVFGTPGAHAQVQTNFQLAVGLIDFGLDVQTAIEEPRWYHEAGVLRLEGRWPRSVRHSLAARGHEIALLPDWSDVTGGAQAISIDGSGVLAGGADPRREGTAAGY